MYSDGPRDHNELDCTAIDINGPDAHVCNAGTGTPFGLDETCPDCRAPGGVDCDWSCSSNWN